MSIHCVCRGGRIRRPCEQSEQGRYMSQPAFTHIPINMVVLRRVKTTLEIPDVLFRRAKSVAAQRGIPLRQLVTEAVQEKLKTTSEERPWMKHMGKLKHLRGERKQLEKRVQNAFEQIDSEIWK